MRHKIITAQEAADMVKDGSRVMIGGFMSCGTPEVIMDALVAKGTKNITVIANDAGTGGEKPTGIGKLVSNKQVKKLIASHIGLNKDVATQMHDGDIEVQLVPQGTLAEQIRAGGAGLGGVLTPTGIGTEVAEGKEVLTLNGKEYLLEMPIKADFALIRGSIVDKAGNVYYHKTTRNFKPMMATAAET
ncbi:MAG: CoA transferase subunit A, partial [Clostridiales bacterium]|nr:CoA transferase subunit A [Clostridiales bacterium]